MEIIKAKTFVILFFSFFSVSLEQCQSYIPDLINILPDQPNVRAMSNSDAFLLSYAQDDLNKFKQYRKAIATSEIRQKSICHSSRFIKL